MSFSRSFAKTVSFRLTVIVVDIPLLVWLTGNFMNGLLATTARHLVETITFWLHEQLWQHVPYGKPKQRATALRSLVKTATYRIFSVAVDTAILSSWLEVRAALGGAVIVALTNSAVYFIHERVWAVRARILR